MPYNPGVSDISGQLLGRGMEAAALARAQGVGSIGDTIAGLLGNYTKRQADNQEFNAKNQAMENFIRTNASRFSTAVDPETGEADTTAVEDFLKLGGNPKEKFTRMNAFLQNAMMGDQMRRTDATVKMEEANRLATLEATKDRQRKREEDKARAELLKGVFAPERQALSQEDADYYAATGEMGDTGAGSTTSAPATGATAMGRLQEAIRQGVVLDPTMLQAFQTMAQSEDAAGRLAAKNTELENRLAAAKAMADAREAAANLRLQAAEARTVPEYQRVLNSALEQGNISQEDYKRYLNDYLKTHSSFRPSSLEGMMGLMGLGAMGANPAFQNSGSMLPGGTNLTQAKSTTHPNAPLTQRYTLTVNPTGG